MPPFLVTGCGRSGTGYAAALFTALGIPCGHEALFSVGALGSDAPPAWPAEVEGESSWLAAPFFLALPPGTVVLHQVREPLAVIRSFARTRFFEGRHVWKRFAERHAPELARGTPLERCVAYWLCWNQLAASAATHAHLVYRRHRLEDLGVERVAQLCEALGRPRSRERIAAAMARVPRDTNTSGVKDGDSATTWASLPRSGAWSELEQLAARWGYVEGSACASEPARGC